MTDFRVYVICPRCDAQLHLHVIGGWDVADVRHDCPPPGPTAHEHLIAQRDSFDVTYDPPRRVF